MSFNFSFKNFICFFVLIFFFPRVAAGARLYFGSQENIFQPNDTFMVSVRAETKECINLIEAIINFPSELLEAVDTRKSDSIIGLWLQEPLISQDRGEVAFIGGIPAGYCGRIAGDIGESNILIKIVFRVKEAALPKDSSEAEAAIDFSQSSKAFLNDGLGSRSELDFSSFAFVITKQRSEPLSNQWEKEIVEDRVPPESFEVEVYRAQNIFDNQYFLIFSTDDKQSGLSHFLVKEGDGPWEKAVSPYLLKDQSLNYTIKVKAVDKAGNEKIVESFLGESLPQRSFMLKYPITFVIITAFLITVYFLFLKQRVIARQKQK